jgi:hypothetical protein
MKVPEMGRPFVMDFLYLGFWGFVLLLPPALAAIAAGTISAWLRFPDWVTQLTVWGCFAFTLFVWIRGFVVWNTRKSGSTVGKSDERSLRQER